MAETLDPLFAKLRERALAWQDPGAPPGSPSGIIMETGYAEGVVMLVVMSTGTADLYFSKGGGLAGAGAHPGPKLAARELAMAAAHLAEKMHPAVGLDLPKLGYTKIYILIDGLVRCAEARESDFGSNRSQFSPLFHLGHRVIGEMRRLPAPEQPEF